ncbi:helix-turn-helix transcriptional regulator [Listeria innocua]|nr:helix-turn-helix transcriptional regulator [Listeria monocytogenes]ELD8333495.1 helix-turn-helix transcriptional regulator [Listeria innocua]ELY0464587.1 helix-turn-helix transcriptional regulator [Listeria innocua]ELY0467467.1 helix-turn-helix transcriptional regulator [Listeria innocua]ELY0470419.1 helix-turn-helix transcriptional regulator [Listeria innocua]
MQKIRPDMDIGKNIQRLRNNSKMTQDQVVAKMNIMGLNISKSTYAKLETNRMNIRVSELVALKMIFNANFNDFFEDLILK